MRSTLALLALAAPAFATFANAQAPEKMELLTSYFDCSEKAEIRQLSQAEITDCINLYMMVKLSFLDDVDLVSFRKMSTEDREEANKRGYAAYYDWRQSNPAIVERMEADARARVSKPNS